MRPSDQPLLKPIELNFPNAEFFAAVAREVPITERRGAILLVGGSDFRSCAVRRAQASLRFDLRASYWSHAALIRDWPEGDPANATGLEASIDLAAPACHKPEDNGVTTFSLARYFDAVQYPNLCIALVAESKTTLRSEDALLPVDPDWRKHLLNAAQNPNAARPQFTFYAWLAEWIRFAMLPYSVPNPLLEGMPHPGAAFVDYACNAAGLDLVPGASSPATSPEHLWATFLHWHGHVGERWGELKAWTRINQKECPS